MIDDWDTRGVIGDVTRILDSIPETWEGIKGGLLYGYRPIIGRLMGHKWDNKSPVGPTHSARQMGRGLLSSQYPTLLGAPFEVPQ